MHFLDRAEARPGICRLAIPLAAGDDRLALFFCLTVEQAMTDEAGLVAQLRHHGQRLVGG